MVAYWLWTSRKVGSHFADSKQAKNLVVILVTLEKSKKLVIILLTLTKSKNLVAILLLIVGHGCFLDILLNPFYS